jgi:hypothetical protein
MSSYRIRYAFIHPYLNCLPGDDIAVKGFSVQHVMDILHACGVEISEGETLFKEDEKKVVSVDGSESMLKVVRGIHMILGHMSLCCIPLDIFVRYPT